MREPRAEAESLAFTESFTECLFRSEAHPPDTEVCEESQTWGATRVVVVSRAWSQANPGFVSDRQPEIDRGPIRTLFRIRDVSRCRQCQTHAAPGKQVCTWQARGIGRDPSSCLLCSSKRYQESRCPSFRGWPGSGDRGDWLALSKTAGVWFDRIVKIDQGRGPVTSPSFGVLFGGRSRQLLVVDEGVLPFGPLCFLDHKLIQRQERLTCPGP